MTDRRAFNVYLPDWAIKKLKELAKEREVSPSQLITDMISDYKDCYYAGG
jgi:hypothetical protein